MDPIRLRAAMLVAVHDLRTGERRSHPHDTPTVDVPFDFPRTGGVFTVGDGFRGSYTSADGKHVVHNVTQKPLAWRSRGETCLIARAGGARQFRQYRLCQVAPEEVPVLRDGLTPRRPD